MSEETKFEIESGIPVPPLYVGRRKDTYRIREMAVGDSFFVPFPEGVPPKVFRARIHSYAGQLFKRERDAAKAAGKNNRVSRPSLRVREWQKDGVSGLRVWRAS